MLEYAVGALWDVLVAALVAELIGALVGQAGVLMSACLAGLQVDLW